MSKVDTGGQAFARPDAGFPFVFGGQEGMTYRQWLAGMALCGYRESGNIRPSSEIAKWCLEDADALIKAESANGK